MSSLAIFDPHNIPRTNCSRFPTYGKKSIEVLLNHYGEDKFALSLDEETVKTAVISPKLHTEWISFHTLLAKKPEESIALQLESLSQMKCWLQCSQTYKRYPHLGVH